MEVLRQSVGLKVSRLRLCDDPLESVTALLAEHTKTPDLRDGVPVELERSGSCTQGWVPGA